VGTREKEGIEDNR